jgi:hypothetical protein
MIMEHVRLERLLKRADDFASVGAHLDRDYGGVKALTVVLQIHLDVDERATQAPEDLFELRRGRPVELKQKSQGSWRSNQQSSPSPVLDQRGMPYCFPMALDHS